MGPITRLFSVLVDDQPYFKGPDVETPGLPARSLSSFPEMGGLSGLTRGAHFSNRIQPANRRIAPAVGSGPKGRGPSPGDCSESTGGPLRISSEMAMGHNLWLHFGVDEHPCTTYFDVHQGFPGFLTHSQIPGVPTAFFFMSAWAKRNKSHVRLRKAACCSLFFGG